MSRTLTRRDFLRITAVGGLSVAALAVKAMPPRFGSLDETRYLMGTIIHMRVVTDDAALGQKAIEDTFSEMSRLVRIFDYRDAESPLSRLNRDGRLSQAPPELCSVLRSALKYGELTEGAFDVTVKPILDRYAAHQEPSSSDLSLVDYRHVHLAGNDMYCSLPGMGITLDGIAKGYIVNGGVNVLQNTGFQNVLVEAGGDLMSSGVPGDRPSWRIGVADPRGNHEDSLMFFSLKNGAAATSGDYLNYFTADLKQHHIIDPRTGSSPQELASVTIIAPNATIADALSTSVMVLGTDRGLQLVERLPGIEALLISKQMDVVRSSGFPG